MRFKKGTPEFEAIIQSIKDQKALEERITRFSADAEFELSKTELFETYVNCSRYLLSIKLKYIELLHELENHKHCKEWPPTEEDQIVVPERVKELYLAVKERLDDLESLFACFRSVLS